MLSLVHAIHMTAASLALLLFIWRGWWMWRDQPVTKVVWRRIVPDSVDTLLLITGITMMIKLAQYPLEQSWITAKLIAVSLYIALGFIAFRGKGTFLPRAAWLVALLVFGYVLMVAHSQMAWPLA